jgi:Co/Zn/Cd efflux system component
MGWADFPAASLAQMHNALVSALPETFSPETRRRIILIQTLTLVWMTVEAVVSLWAAWMARSPALLGFGGDFVIDPLGTRNTRRPGTRRVSV